MADVWTGFLQGMAAFGQTRAARLVATSFKDTGSFLASLIDGAGDDNTRNALKQLKADIDALSPAVGDIAKAIKKEIDIAVKSTTACADELAKDPFTSANAATCAMYLGEVLAAFDSALLKVAHEAAKKEASPKKEAIEKGIAGITEPWKKPFRELGTSATGDFDKAARQLFNIQNASTRVADVLSFNRTERRLELKFFQAGLFSPMGLAELSFDATELVGFLSFKDKSILGLTIRTKLRAGLRGDTLLKNVIPDGAPSTDATYTSVNLDTDSALTFGDSKSKSLMLPVRLSVPAVELRELALVMPETGGASGEVQLRATIAGKLGVFGVVTEGSGLIFRAAGGAFTVEPRPPDAIGARVELAVFKGGGYLRRNEDFTEFRGALDLRFASFGITAYALIGTKPKFSLVVVISVTFRPKVELSFGFTLNGVGGLLALERAINTDELRKGIQDGTANLLLFPDDPIQAAPKILDKLAKVFPQRAGAFAVGPLFKLGWGSQAAFVVAKVGVLIGLPDPKIILLGALEVGVPSAEIDAKLRIVDLRAEIYGEFAPEFLLVRVGLNRSRLAALPITGDLGILIRWAGVPNVALSVGGFHSRYAQIPCELSDLRRIELDLSPGGLDWIRITAKGFFALTANSLQFGGGVWLHAEIGPATGEAWFSVEALFVWTPRFYFTATLDAGLTAKVFKKTIVGVRLTGEVKGTTPWSIHATALIEIPVFPDVPFEIGPIEWGEKDTSVAQTIRPRDVVTKALRSSAAWTAELPRNADMMVRLVEDRGAGTVVHPLGVLNVRQEMVPLDTRIDRIGQNPARPDKVSMAAVHGGTTTAAVSTVTAFLPPGHYLNLPGDQQVTIPDFNRYPVGIKYAAADAPEHGPAVGVTYQWETRYPQETFGSVGLESLPFSVELRAYALTRNAVSTSARERTNRYLTPRDKLVVTPGPVYELRDSADLSTAAAARMSASDAWRLRDDALRQNKRVEMIAVGVAI